MLLKTDHKSYFVKVITEDHDFAKLKPEWDELLKESSYNNIELTYSWFAGAWKHYKHIDKTAQLRIISITMPDSNVPIAILPLMISKIPFKRVLTIRQLSFLCYPWSDYGGFIIRQQFEKEIVTLFLKQILTNPGICPWDIILLKNLSEENIQSEILLQNVGPLGKTIEVKRKTRYYYIPTEDGQFESYYQTLSSNFRNNLRKAKNRMDRFLQESSGNASFEKLSNINEDALNLFLALNRKRQMSAQRLSAFESIEMSEFTKEFILHNMRYISIFVLTINKKTAAFVISFEYNNSLKCWISGFDSSFEYLSPGQLLFQMIIKYCFEKKLTNIDFMIGDSSYKAKWARDYFTGYQIRKLNPQRRVLNLLTKFKKITHV